MLEKYLKENEIVFFYRLDSGVKKYKTKDIFMEVMGIVFLIFTLISTFLSFYINMFFMILSIFCLIFSVIFFMIFKYSNENSFSENETLDVEYAITNQRFLLYLGSRNKLFEIPIYKFKTNYGSINGNEIHLTNEFASDISNVIIDSKNIFFSREKIVLYHIYNPYKLAFQIQTLRYLWELGKDNIYDITSYVKPNERLLYKEEKTNYKFVVKDYSFTILTLIYVIFSILMGIFYGYSGIFYLLFVIFIILFSYDLINKSAYFIYRNKRYNFSFAITDKRLLFLDLDNLIIYGYELSRSSQYKVCNYDKHNNTGDIFFTHLPYNYVFRRLFSRRSSRYLIQSEHVFPEHYEMHHVGGEKYLFNQETLDIVNIRLYGCSAPFQVLEDYILKDRTD